MWRPGRGSTTCAGSRPGWRRRTWPRSWPASPRSTAPTARDRRPARAASIWCLTCGILVFPAPLLFHGADPVDDRGEGVQVGLVDGVVGEAVPVPVADDLFRHLLDRPDEEERVFQDLLGGHGAAILLRQAGRRLAAVIGHPHHLRQCVPFDL